MLIKITICLTTIALIWVLIATFRLRRQSKAFASLKSKTSTIEGTYPQSTDDLTIPQLEHKLHRFERQLTILSQGFVEMKPDRQQNASARIKEIKKKINVLNEVINQIKEDQAEIPDQMLKAVSANESYHRLGVNNFANKRGFGIPVLLIVVFVISIIGVISLPKIISTRDRSQFAEMQKQIALTLNETRQTAIQQKTPVTFRYDNLNKIFVIYNGSFGALGDARNRVLDLSNFGLEKSGIVYGSPSEISKSTLTDTSNLTELTENSVEIIFQPDGSVIDGANNAQNNALFFYYKKYPKETAFAVSVLGDSGRIKVWGYGENIKDYVEKK